MALPGLPEQPADLLSIQRRVLAGGAVTGIAGEHCHFPQPRAQRRRQPGNSVSDLINAARHRFRNAGRAAYPAGIETAKASAFRPLTAAPLANVNAGYMSADCSAHAAATAPTSSKASQPADSTVGMLSASRRCCCMSSI